MNGPLKNGKSRQILPKSRNLAQPTNGSRNLRFCVCWSHICFSIKSLHFFVLDSDVKMPVLMSWQVSDLPFTTPRLGEGMIGIYQILPKISFTEFLKLRT